MPIASPMPTRLSPITACGRVLSVSIAKLPVGGRLRCDADPQEGAEDVEGVKAPAKAEGELVQVGFDVLFAGAVVTPAQPAIGLLKTRLTMGRCPPQPRPGCRSQRRTSGHIQDRPICRPASIPVRLP